MAEESRQSLPFEPKSHSQPAAKPKRSPIVMNKPEQDSATLADSRIPEAVSRRMIRRAAVCCGGPTVLGMAIFVGAYFLATRGFKLPNVVVLLSSLGCLGLGVLGLTYGILSASWEENSGSWLGLQEFQINFERMKQGYRKNQAQRRSLER
jgi:hypothetical protein